jgi:hypothetical protein
LSCKTQSGNQIAEAWLLHPEVLQDATEKQPAAEADKNDDVIVPPPSAKAYAVSKARDDLSGEPRNKVTVPDSVFSLLQPPIWSRPTKCMRHFYKTTAVSYCILSGFSFQAISP